MLSTCRLEITTLVFFSLTYSCRTLTSVYLSSIDLQVGDEYSVYKEKKKKEQKRVFIFVTVQVLVISMESFMKMELPSQLPTDATHGTQHYNG